MAESTDDGPLTCVTCGEPVADSHTRRVAGRIEDGIAVYDHFCSDTCLDEWADE